VHIPVDPAALSNSPVEEQNQAACLKLFQATRSALDSFTGEVVVACKSGTRASAVLAAYLAVTQGLTNEQMLSWAVEKGSFCFAVVCPSSPAVPRRCEPTLSGVKFPASAAMAKYVARVADAFSRRNGLVFRQLFEKESSTYTYLLVDSLTRTHIAALSPTSHDTATH
jgi:hypothetical protein